jgi:hypothetical protein
LDELLYCFRLSLQLRLLYGTWVWPDVGLRVYDSPAF